MRPEVNDVLRTLIRERQGQAADREVESRLTSLGVPLVRQGERHWTIDLTEVRVFRNLQPFVQLLINGVLEQCGFAATDIMVRQRVDPNLTPELANLGLDWVMLYARLDTAEGFPFRHRQFAEEMQMIFRTLQTGRWGGVLFPNAFAPASQEATGNTPALLFPFHLQDQKGEEQPYFLVEFNRPGRFLRITVETADSSRLQLRHIPHRVVDQKPHRSYLPDIHRIAEQIHQGIQRECLNQRAEYAEIPAQQHCLFDHLRGSGLTRLQSLRFTWPTDDTQWFLIEQSTAPDAPSASLAMLIKEIQLLEDPLVVARLAKGDLIEMVSGPFSIFFDLSRYGACLNVSFDGQRTVLALADYLADMPVLRRALASRQETLAGMRLFLVHHATAEVIGLLAAFEKAGCEALSTFFVKYGGIVPDAYLETLMSLPPEVFHFYGLQKIETRKQLAGAFALSPLFSPLEGLQPLGEVLGKGTLDFFGAMRLAAGHLFLKDALLAKETGKRLLLVEDGGYLAPLINRFCLEGRTVGEVFTEFCLAPPEGEAGHPFADWLGAIFPGSVEHTRNGYDHNEAIQEAHGRLQFPVATIAISSLKRGHEARECAVAILNATENILHRRGALLSRRHCLVLGSSGAIGGFLMAALRHRLVDGSLCGVDMAAPEQQGAASQEVRALEALGKERLAGVDLVLGIVGRSVLTAEYLETLLAGTQRAIYFASGSTKTVEFTDLEAYLQALRDATAPKIGELAVQVASEPLRDLQTGVLQGYQVRLTFPEAPEKDKTLYLLGGLMPINFLYYGIPREMIDEVMAQLFTVTCGLVGRDRSGAKLVPRLLAVDRDIDAEACPLGKS